jgi:hypothetical protein
MLNTDQINDLHRFYWSDRWPIRKIERHLHRGWRTIKKYSDMPAQTPAIRGIRGSSATVRFEGECTICSKESTR